VRAEWSGAGKRRIEAERLAHAHERDAERTAEVVHDLTEKRLKLFLVHVVPPVQTLSVDPRRSRVAVTAAPLSLSTT
jgi:hypothetical protein